jgi:hypothetical protein
VAASVLGQLTEESFEASWASVAAVDAICRDDASREDMAWLMVQRDRAAEAARPAV